jgi:hypothetical protein
MKTTYLLEWFKRLDDAVSRAKGFAGTSAELEAFLSAHLVVLCAGAYEDCIEHLFVERASKTKDAEIQVYVQNTCHLLFRNPKFQNIVNALKLFSDAYATNLEAKVDTSAREAIGSMVTNKLNVSHGKISAVTLGDVENYHNRTKPIFDALEEILGLP